MSRSSMYPSNIELKNTNRGKLVGEDLSPILKRNSCVNDLRKYFKNDTNPPILKRNSCMNDLKEYFANAFSNETDSDKTEDLITQLNTVKIHNDDQIDHSEAKIMSDRNMNSVRKKMYTGKLSEKTKRKPQKENVQIANRVEEPDQPKSRKKDAMSKKKDSFFVSDDSTISNNIVTYYHERHSEYIGGIKADVRKMTPRARLSRKSVSTNDDGIFTPYVIGKRSSSESNFSDEENGIDHNPKLKSPRTTLPSQLFPTSKVKDRTLEFSDDRESSTLEKNVPLESDSINLFSNSERKKKNRTPLLVPRPTLVQRNFLKDISWAFSDDSSSTEKKLLTNDEKSNPVIPSKVKQSSKEQSEKASVTTPTPITFRLKKIKNLTPKLESYKKNEPFSFLKSLSTYSSPHVLHPDAEQYRKKFKKLKEELTIKLFKMFNEKVFHNRLPSDLKIEWSARLRSSSGLCYNKRIKDVKGINNEFLRVSRIVLSTKVIETPDRLRDTLIHEMCHAAAWIIDNKCDGHGPRWRSWVTKAMKEFPELPSIRRCHDYSVDTKFKYRCIKCGYTIGRHSKSLNLERKRCGYCYGQFELILKNENVANLNLNRTNSSPKNTKAKPLSKFALFVKENYGKVKSKQPNLKHGEIMKELSKDFAFTKILS